MQKIGLWIFIVMVLFFCRLAVSMSFISIHELPEEAKHTLQLIKRGGPFPYTQDNTVFGNFENRLPAQPSGYYHEYTVLTPGARDRGKRRIVAGKIEYYYTPDHYNNFWLIKE